MRTRCKFVNKVCSQEAKILPEIENLFGCFARRMERLAVSELIRRAIDRFLKTKAKNIDWNSDPLTKAVGKIKLTVTDAAVGHDHYLYGRGKRR